MIGTWASPTDSIGRPPLTGCELLAAQVALSKADGCRAISSPATTRLSRLAVITVPTFHRVLDASSSSLSLRRLDINASLAQMCSDFPARAYTSAWPSLFYAVATRQRAMMPTREQHESALVR